MSAPHSNAKTKLLDAALTVIRRKGYAATTVDDLCRQAGVTKGAFFHHFRSKEELGVAAADYWATVTGERFAAAPYHELEDPLDRLLGYVEFRKTLLRGDLPDYTCLVGTMVQETFATSPPIRNACNRSICDHAGLLEADIAAAMQRYRVAGDWTARSLALHAQAVIQGAFVLAKAQNSPDAAADCIDHLHRYIESLFPATPSQRTPRSGSRHDGAKLRQTITERGAHK